MSRFSPTDDWPAHPKQCWRETLDAARDYGWSLLTHSSHAWGTIKCPEEICEFKVFSTGAAAEGSARTARRKVERCPHGPAHAEAVAVISAALIKAERLIKAATQLRLRDAAEQSAEMLQEAEGVIDGSAVWDEFGKLVDEADAHEHAAAAAFNQAGEQHETAVEALHSADGHVRKAKTSMSGKTLSAELRKLKAWATDLREQIRSALSG